MFRTIKNFINKYYRLFICLFGLITLTLAVMRAFIVKNSMTEIYFENKQQYRLPTNATTNAFAAIVVGFIVVYIIFSLFCQRKRDIGKEGELNYFSSIFTGFMCFSLAIYLLAEIAFFHFEADSFFISLCILLLLSSAYFIINAIGLLKTKPAFLTLLSLLPIFTVIIRLVKTFVETTDFQSLSSYPYLITALSLLLIFFVNEGKGYIYKTTSKAYVFSGLSAMLVLSVYSLPDIILRMFHCLEMNDQALLSIIDIVFCIYIFSSLLSLKSAKAKDISNKQE